MKYPQQINTEGVTDHIKQTLQASVIPIYDWMLDTGLGQADLLVYAALFDVLRHEPLTPMHISQKEIAKRVHYSQQSVGCSLNVLRNAKLIFTQGERRNMLFSLYPFDTLDLK
jgi:DNA-binding MarR family transcriptional regulator